jgi:hypothetical protein
MDWREHTDAIRIVRGDRNVDHLRFGGPQFVVHLRFRSVVRARLRVWFSARRMALWSGRGDLGGGCHAALVSLATIKAV